MQNKMKTFHVGISAEAFAAALFAHAGYDVSVQYGANQPEYDLISGLQDSLQNDYLTNGRDKAEVDFSTDEEILKAIGK